MNEAISTARDASSLGVSASGDWSLRVSAVLCGAGLVAWGLADARFRHADGSLATIAAFPFSAGAALVVSASLSRLVGRRSACWIALLFVGQAAALQLTLAGPAIRYQHIRPLQEWLSPDVRAATSIIVLQLVLVAWHWRRIVAASKELLAALSVSPLAWSGIGAAVVFSSAALSRNVTDYALELAVATTLQLLALATLGLALNSIPSHVVRRLSAYVERLLDGRSRSRAWLDPVAVVAAVSVTVAAVGLNWWSYGSHPHVPDEVTYLFHARYLAEGQLWLEPPPVPAAFNVDQMFLTAGDRWLSPVPVGWPAVLALGTLINAPWLVNPVLGGINILLLFALTERLWSRRAARLTVVLAATSPWFVFLAMSYMTHHVTLTAALVAAICVARSVRSPGLTWPLAAGVATGVAALVRPLDGVVVAGVMGVWTLTIPGLWRKIQAVATLAGGAFATGVVPALIYNHLTMGHALAAPYTVWADAMLGKGTNALGFGPGRGLGWNGLDPFPGHGFVDVLVNTALNAFSLNIELFGWATGSMMALALFSVLPGKRRADWMSAAAALWVVVVYSLYWYSGGPDFGARYWFLAVVPCVMLAARAFELADQYLGPAWPSVRVAAIGLCVGTMIVFFPWRAIDKYHQYRGMRPDIRELAAEHRFGRDLVLIRGRRHPDYASAFIYNPVDLHASVPIYAWNVDPKTRDEVVQSFRDRRVWLVEGPSRTGSRFEVVAGPLIGLAAVRAAEGQVP